jgi:hypothetical protein
MWESSNHLKVGVLHFESGHQEVANFWFDAISELGERVVSRDRALRFLGL